MPIKPLKSKNNRKCLTKCYDANETVIHPITLDRQHFTTSNCAIDSYYDDNDVNVWFDECNVEDNQTSILPNEINIFLFKHNFGPEEFLNNIYKIYSLDDTINWIKDNVKLLNKTKIRVTNISFSVYGNEIKQFTNNTVNYFYNFALRNWVPKYINKINNKKFEKYIEEKFTEDLFFKIYKKYVNEFTNKWNTIGNHLKKMEIYILNILNILYKK